MTVAEDAPPLSAKDGLEIINADWSALNIRCTTIEGSRFPVLARTRVNITLKRKISSTVPMLGQYCGTCTSPKSRLVNITAVVAPKRFSNAEYSTPQ